MKSDAGTFQIVFVTGRYALAGASPHTRVYRRRNAGPIPGGYYVAERTAEGPRREFDERALVGGPFALVSDARSALGRLASRGHPAGEVDAPTR